MVDIGFNFRNTVGFVTDGAGETHVISSDTYPTTRDGVTFGWEDSPNLTRNRNSGIDRRLAGTHVETAKVFIRFRVDLDSATDHDINLSLGDTFNAKGDYEIRDNTTVLDSATDLVSNANERVDATFVVRTSNSDWVTNQATASFSFSSTIFRIAIKESTTSSGAGINHLRIKEVIGAITGTGAITLGSIALSGTAIREIVAIGAIILPNIELASTGIRTIPGTGTITLPAIIVAGSALEDRTEEHINNLWIGYLRDRGHTGTINDVLSKAFKVETGATSGTLNDLMMLYFIQQGITSGTVDDRMLAFLKANYSSFEGTVQDRIRQVLRTNQFFI